MTYNRKPESTPNATQRRRMCKRKSLGVVAIEFALIFPAFFLLFYGIVTYGLIFAAQQTLTLAAAEGARAAVRYPGGAADSMTSRASMACAATSAPLFWLKQMGGLGTAGTTTCGTDTAAAGVTVVPRSGMADCGTSGNCIRVSINYDYASHALVPPLLGALGLPTPSVLHARAVAQVNLL